MRKLYLLIVLLLLTSCALVKESQKEAVVLSMGIMKDEHFKVYLEVLDKKETEQKIKTKVCMGEGDSIVQALNDATIKLGEKLYFKNLTLIGFESYLTSDVAKILTKIEQFYDIPYSTSLVVLSDCASVYEGENISFEIDGILEQSLALYNLKSASLLEFKKGELLSLIQVEKCEKNLCLSDNEYWYFNNVPYEIINNEEALLYNILNNTFKKTYYCEQECLIFDKMSLVKKADYVYVSLEVLNGKQLLNLDNLKARLNKSLNDVSKQKVILDFTYKEEEKTDE